MTNRKIGKPLFIIGCIHLYAFIIHSLMSEWQTETARLFVLASLFVIFVGGMFWIIEHAELFNQSEFKYRRGQRVQYIAEEDTKFKNRTGIICESFLDGNGERWYIIEEDENGAFHVPECYIMDTI